MNGRIREGTSFGSSSSEGLEGISTKTLIRELLQESQGLVRGEISLAKVELKEELKEAAQGAGAIGVAAVLGHVALLCFAACFIAVLSLVMHPWVASFIAVLVFGGAAAGLFVFGKRKIHVRAEQTVHHLEEDRRWMKSTLQRMKSSTHASA